MSFRQGVPPKQVTTNQQFESEDTAIGKVPQTFSDQVCSYCKLDHKMIKGKILGPKISPWYEWTTICFPFTS